MSDLQVVVAVIDAAEILAQRLRDSDSFGSRTIALMQVIAAVRVLRREATLENSARLAAEIEAARKSIPLDVAEAAENFCLAVCEALADEVPLEADEMWDEALAEIAP